MSSFAGLLAQVRRNTDALRGRRVILWTHSGLGDQISASRIVEKTLESGVEVLWPVMGRNFDFVSKAFSNWEGLTLFRMDDSKRESYQVLWLSVKSKTRIVDIGHRQLSKMQSLFPEFSLNSIFNLFAGLGPLDLVSEKLRTSLAYNTQINPLETPFAFLDHHPNTYREVPRGVIESIRSRGLTVYENPRDAPLYSTIGLLDNAREIHLVNSAPLCLALTINAKASRRCHYDSRRDPISKSYPRWESIPITGLENLSHFVKPVEPTPETEAVRLEVLNQTGWE